MQEFLQQLINGLSVGSIYALIAVGYTMVYGVLQLINFAHGDVFMVGAIIAFIVGTRALPVTFPMWLHVAIWLGLALGLAIPLLNGQSRRDMWVGARCLFILYVLYLALIIFEAIIGVQEMMAQPGSWLKMIDPPLWLQIAVPALIVLGLNLPLLFAFRRDAIRWLRQLFSLYIAVILLEPFIFARSLPMTFPFWFQIGSLVVIGLGTLLLLYFSNGDAFRSLRPFVILYLAMIVLQAAMSLFSRSKHVSNSSWLIAALAIVMAVAACGAIGFVIERVAYRPLRNKPRINSLITAIGISLLLEYGGQNSAVFGPTPQAFPNQMVPGINEHWQVLGLIISKGDVLVLAITLALMIVLSYIVLKTKTGLALRAVSLRFDTAALMGINIDRIISFTFVLGSALAAVAGVLYSEKYPSVQPLMGLLPGIKAFVAAVFGGIGNIAGAVVGGMILGLVEVLVVGYLPGGSQYRDGVAFVILIVILLVKPSGLFGKHAVEKV